MAHSDEEKRVIPGTWIDSDRFVPRAFVQPTLRFMRLEAAGGILMLIAAIIAVSWANSPFQESYFNLFDTVIEFDILGAEGAEAGDKVLEETDAQALATVDAAESGGHSAPVINIGPLEISHLTGLSVRAWINDALMAIFFFIVGLEIKRELVVGELRDPKAAALPALAAIGGMVIPAGIYLFFNAGGENANGWGIPMATDIAFAVGVLAMVGRRVPVSAKLFLLALAIVDDLGAIAVIALFYTEQLFFDWLGVAIVGLLIVYAMQRVNVRSTAAYIILGTMVWVAVLESGVHATVAGVALALMTPVKAYLDPSKFGQRADALAEQAKRYIPDGKPLHEEDHHTLERVQGIMNELRTLSRESMPPLTRLEFKLQPWTSYVIVPIFALANAGVIITSDMFADVLGDDVLIGIFSGLLVGKVVGVVLFAWIAIKLGLAKMPRNVTWHHIFGVGLLAGIGFTVALFVSALSFEPGSAAADSSKLGIFAASLMAGVGGYVWLKFFGADPGEDDQPDHEPELVGATH